MLIKCVGQWVLSRVFSAYDAIQNLLDFMMANKMKTDYESITWMEE